MNLSDYLRLPIRAGVGLTKIDTTNGILPVADFSAPDYFKILVDNLNHCLLSNLIGNLPGEAFLLAYVRGSVVQDRLEFARTFWPRTGEVFELHPMIQALEHSYGQTAVTETIYRIKREIYAKLLYDGRSLGASKLVFRMRKPDDELLSPANYAAIEKFVGELSNLSNDCEQTVRDLFAEADLGEARHHVRKQYHLLLSRFGLDSGAGQGADHFDRFVEILEQCRCLHPALPIAEEAVLRTAQVFGITNERSRQLLTLFRFACLSCRLEKPKHFSDIAFKCIAVIPQSETASDEVKVAAENTLMEVFRTLEYTTRTQVDLQRFGEKYPEVRITNMAFVWSLPQPLFEAFLLLDSAEERLNLVTKYRIGPAYFRKYFADLFHRPAWRDKFLALDLKYHHGLSTGFDDLLKRIVFVRNGIATTGYTKHETILPLGISYDDVRQWLASAVAQANAEAIAQASRLFDEIAKDDLVGHVRGAWTVKNDGGEIR
ncbi:MAG: hypothetical protein ONB44_09750 [candidate division KSB1 bacterium]|nr:hypothetical protein [candidate division KSB1 bacterium]MDZ7302409.1 hypothetical protein [candidate division KSB1 bacterium]MDZ7311611.1 hypothetical protein [candidate division KSB1 bacterium]